MHKRHKLFFHNNVLFMADYNVYTAKIMMPFFTTFTVNKQTVFIS